MNNCTFTQHYHEKMINMWFLYAWKVITKKVQYLALVRRTSSTREGRRKRSLWDWDPRDFLGTHTQAKNGVFDSMKLLFISWNVQTLAFGGASSIGFCCSKLRAQHADVDVGTQHTQHTIHLRNTQTQHNRTHNTLQCNIWRCIVYFVPNCAREVDVGTHIHTPCATRIHTIARTKHIPLIADCVVQTARTTC